MRKTTLPIFLSLTALTTLSLIYLHQVTSVKSAAATNIVISEIMVRGSSANDEFIELYNPTSSPVDLAGWRLTKKPQDGSPETSLVASLSGTIPSNGFFLITHDESFASPSADLVYSSGVIADDNTLSLFSDSGTTLVDKVGFGTALDTETTAAATPSSGQSLERKANSSSTPQSMSSGVDINMGNAEDTNNNGDDFVVRDVPQPQNSQSDIEPEATPSPTATPSATPTATPSASPTAQPTPTATPSATPTSIPSATPTSSPSATPSSAPNPFFGLNISCQIRVRTLNFGFFRISFPQLFCTLK
ncbi:hypothetical protein A3C99_01655 [Candidatus Daviesbacteria bacterium RIFCSPHIGHO2_02_FULL_37_9]|nr:MAG: hypothetical protein A3C99_01655 [Candidatus Daviesbacteria bacterium RIFCSPHIGHO2_02_FULL_37_9]